MILRRKKSNNKSKGEVRKLSGLLTFFLFLIVVVLLMAVGGTIAYFALTLDLPAGCYRVLH